MSRLKEAGDSSPRPLEDKELEAVAGGVGVWTITFSCCQSSYQFIAQTKQEAIDRAIGEHVDAQTHSAGSYSVSGG